MKRLTIFTLVFFLLFSLNTLAHTGLESSSPQNGENITKELEQITLTFETKIEQGSTLEVKNALGENISVNNIILSDNQLIGDLSKPLENGDYTIHWNIIGADGHPIDGVISFSVNIPQTEEQEEESPQEELEFQTQDEEKDTDTETNQIIKAEEPEENSSSPYFIPAVIGGLILIAIISIFLLRRKK